MEMTPESRAVTLCLRDRSAVRALWADFTRGRSPAQVPVMSAGVIVPSMAPLMARSRYSTSSRVHNGWSTSPS